MTNSNFFVTSERVKAFAQIEGILYNIFQYELPKKDQEQDLNDKRKLLKKLKILLNKKEKRIVSEGRYSEEDFCILENIFMESMDEEDPIADIKTILERISYLILLDSLQNDGIDINTSDVDMKDIYLAYLISIKDRLSEKPNFIAQKYRLIFQEPRLTKELLSVDFDIDSYVDLRAALEGSNPSKPQMFSCDLVYARECELLDDLLMTPDPETIEPMLELFIFQYSYLNVAQKADIIYNLEKVAATLSDITIGDEDAYSILLSRINDLALDDVPVEDIVVDSYNLESSFELIDVEKAIFETFEALALNPNSEKMFEQLKKLVANEEAIVQNLYLDVKNRLAIIENFSAEFHIDQCNNIASESDEPSEIEFLFLKRLAQVLDDEEPLYYPGYHEITTEFMIQCLLSFLENTQDTHNKYIMPAIYEEIFRSPIITKKYIETSGNLADRVVLDDTLLALLYYDMDIEEVLYDKQEIYSQIVKEAIEDISNFITPQNQMEEARLLLLKTKFEIALQELDDDKVQEIKELYAELTPHFNKKYLDRILKSKQKVKKRH